MTKTLINNLNTPAQLSNITVENITVTDKKNTDHKAIKVTFPEIDGLNAYYINMNTGDEEQIFSFLDRGDSFLQVFLGASHPLGVYVARNFITITNSGDVVASEASGEFLNVSEYIKNQAKEWEKFGEYDLSDLDDRPEDELTISSLLKEDGENPDFIASDFCSAEWHVLVAVLKNKTGEKFIRENAAVGIFDEEGNEVR